MGMSILPNMYTQIPERHIQLLCNIMSEHQLKPMQDSTSKTLCVFTHYTHINHYTSYLPHNKMHGIK